MMLLNLGVKLISDYFQAAYSEDLYQAVLQVVEDNRKLVTNLR